MKRIAIAVFFCLFFLGFGTQNTGADEKSGLLTERPWFVPPGVVAETKPVKQYQEFMRDMVSNSICFQGNANLGANILIPGNDSFSATTSVVSTSGTKKNPTKMRIVLDHYVATEIEVNGKPVDGYIVTTFCGKREVTKHQVDVIIAQLSRRAEEASEDDYKELGSVPTNAIALLKEQLGDKGTDLGKHPDDVIPGYEKEHIRYRDYYYLLSNLKPSDFVPRELHLGYNIELSGILGVTWLETGVVYYNPQAWMADTLWGTPKVLEHEFVHASPLQEFPLADAFDVELEASMPMMLATDDQVSLFFHGYTVPLRKPIKVYFGFDFDRARKEMIKFDDTTGNLFIDNDAWERHFAELDRIKTALRPFFMGSKDSALAEFYHDPWYWASMNHRWNDKNSYIYLLLAKHFCPTLLGGCKATQDWINANATTITQIGKDAWNSTVDSETTIDSADGDITIPPYLVKMYEQLVSRPKREELRVYYTKHPQELRKLFESRENLVGFAKSLGIPTLGPGGVQ